MDKQVTSVQEAVADIKDGATIMLGGFGAAGVPFNLIFALIEQGSKNLTIICNGITEFLDLVVAKRIKKVVTSYAALPKSIMPVNPFEEQYIAGEVELELVPEGTLPERIRAAGVGLGGFYTKVGVGTFVEKGKESKIIDGKKYIYETPLRADFALVKGYLGDRYGNLIYRKAARNQNPIIAMAGHTTIAEVEKIVDVGQLDPEAIVTPGIFVDRIVQVPKRTGAFKIKF